MGKTDAIRKYFSGGPIFFIYLGNFYLKVLLYWGYPPSPPNLITPAEGFIFYLKKECFIGGTPQAPQT